MPLACDAVAHAACCSCSCSLPLSVNSFGQAAAAQLGVCDIFQMLLQQNKSGDKYKVSRSSWSHSQSQSWRRSTSGCISALGKRADMPPVAATLPQSFGLRTRNRFWQRHTTADDGVTIPVDQRACSGSCSPFRRLRCLTATSCCRCSCACTHACPKLFRQHSFKAADEAASAAASTAAA